MDHEIERLEDALELVRRRADSGSRGSAFAGFPPTRMEAAN